MDNIFLQYLTNKKPNHIKMFVLLFAICTLLFLNFEVYAMQKPKHIILLGASVGKAWEIEDLPKRQNIQGYRFEYVGEYQFDKSKALQQILQRKENKPDAILIKGCAAYFPGDLLKYQALMRSWVQQCKKAGVIPIPTTVIPVVREQGFINIVKNIVKKILGKSTNASRLTAIFQYNDWIKSYAQKEGLVVLDLEASLRTNEIDRSLRIDLQIGDGLHLNRKAYSILDQILIPCLEKIYTHTDSKPNKS
jgi:hypothetical protein